MMAQVLIEQDAEVYSEKRDLDLMADKASQVSISIKSDKGKNRVLVDSLMELDNLPKILETLKDLNPILIGAWDQDGKIIKGYEMDMTLYKTYIASGAIAHQFMGWGIKK